jgi:hypothetical protein
MRHEKRFSVLVVCRIASTRTQAADLTDEFSRLRVAAFAVTGTPRTVNAASPAIACVVLISKPPNSLPCWENMA